jgi:tetratricopeptide (TPR) repeat protein
MKPGNVMLRPDGNLTLIDFGTAREFKARNIADTTCLGTIGYAAPEQFGGQGQTDARTDIYGLGATLYHLVTGLNPSEPPYEIRPIRELDPTLSGGLEKIILKCVQKNPDDRYQSAEELMYALENYEKVDDQYRSMLKVRLASFFAVLALAIVFSILAVGNQMIASGNAGKEYVDLIADAKTTADYETSLKKFEAAINIPDQNGQSEAYLGLIQAYKANDHLFTVDEARQLERLISENRDALLKNPKEYVDICFETGKLFWYYYAYGGIENNQVTRAKSAIEWFQEVMRYAPQDYENLAMAEVYSNVGIFYRDIQTAVTEADDKGRYKPLFDNIVQMTESIAKNENESEIVRLELLELGRSALQQYATKLKVDGVTEDEMRALLSDIRSILENIQTTTETSTNRKEESLRHIGQTQKAIDTAFSTGKDQ